MLLDNPDPDLELCGALSGFRKSIHHPRTRSMDELEIDKHFEELIQKYGFPDFKGDPPSPTPLEEPSPTLVQSPPITPPPTESPLANSTFEFPPPTAVEATLLGETTGDYPGEPSVVGVVNGEREDDQALTEESTTALNVFLRKGIADEFRNGVPGAPKEIPLISDEMESSDRKEELR
ncbi:hypothetical protein SISSUDRAFT_1037993 [Sistotremastrum suecicum HHB10207 ss-3]|uniref:Uncharacterized protein n=1 Tax=Sistotremastrum suecicum HHB10207 ss-3 TaxID=1314776 RepID=A0A165XCG7_9AGAM|nr:hypothetical protein SISSUDRAFT_1037993 [Sistotremastrum suecicum HHB10207 ss-3]